MARPIPDVPPPAAAAAGRRVARDVDDNAADPAATLAAIRPAALAIRRDAALAALRQQARPDRLVALAGFGLNPDQRLGLSVPALRALARQIGRDHDLALALCDTGIPEAQILAAYLAEPARLSVAQMNHWITRLQAWDTCDQACTNAFAPSPLAWGRVPVWARRAAPFERRAAFALLAALAVHDKAAPDAPFLASLACIEAAADDDRPYVRKGVNWALRQIGKRNATLLPAAIACAEGLQRRPSRAARWIAADALRELRARRPA